MTRRWKVGLLAFFSIILLLVAAGALLRMNTKKHSPVDKITTVLNGANIEIVYCQPSKKGRLIFGEEVAEDAEEAGPLQPWGSYWRMGANEATTIQVSNTINFGGQELAAGLYSMYAIPRQETWTIGINSVANRWGYNEPDYEKDVLSITVPVSYKEEVIEMFTMAFDETNDNTELVLNWDTSEVRIPIN
jgi:hypothetical protein